MKREASSDAEDRPFPKQARLSSGALESDEHSSLAVKQSVEPLFRRLCRDFDWSPTELICEKISDLLSIDTSRNDNVEPALFAFVQHLPFIWNDGALFIGSKRINKSVRSVWYKPLNPGDSVGESLYLEQTDSYHGMKFHKCTPKVDGSLVDRFWPSFNTIFGLSSQSGDYRNIMGVHTILLTFPKLRKSCSGYELQAWAEARLTSATDHTPLRKYELPFLPESVWMSKPIESKRSRPTTPSAGWSSRLSPQLGSTTVRRSSFKDIERVQSLIQSQRRQIVDSSEQQGRRHTGSRGHNISESIDRPSEHAEAAEAAFESATEVSNDAASQVDREVSPMGLLGQSAVNRGNQIVQQDDVEVSLSTPDHGTEARVRLTITLPSRILGQQPVLHFSPVASVDLPPIVSPRRLVLEALCALAMTTADNDTR
jgi:hypothetical protein